MTPDGTRVYVAILDANVVSVIDTATNTVVGSPIPVGAAPTGIVVNSSGTLVFVANSGSNSVSVIDTATNTVLGSPIPVGAAPTGIAIAPNIPIIPTLSDRGLWVLCAALGVAFAMHIMARRARSL